MAPAGRPKIGKEKRKRVNVMLEPTIHEFLSQAGDGNVSAGIHIVTMGWMAYRAHETLKRLPKKGSTKDNPFGKFSKKAVTQTEETIRVYRRPSN